MESQTLRGLASGEETKPHRGKDRAEGTWRQRTRSVPSAFAAANVRKKNETVEIAAAPIRWPLTRS